jgi:outer membrane immunogenic protein
MKKIILGMLAGALSAAPALAADMPVKAPPRVAEAVVSYNWTGWYFGVNGGYGWGKSKYREPTEFDAGGAIFNYADFSYDSKGWIFGITSGYNWQSGRFVFGYEGDSQITGIKGDIRFPASIFAGNPSPFFNTDVKAELDYYGTARLRAGYLVTPSALAYVTGGFAYGRIESTLSFPNIDGTPNTFIDKDKRWHYGYAAGGGLEFKWTDRWSFKGEYMYVNLGNKTHDFVIAGDLYTWRERLNLHTVRVGLNYQWWPTAVVARY